MSTEQEFSEGLPNLKAASLYKTVTDLYRIGARWPGTPGEARARDYIHEKMMDCGLENVRLDGFDYLNYIPIDSDLKVISPFESSIVSAPLQYSANDTTEGEIIYAGAGTEAEFKELDEKGADFDGKIILSRTYNPYWVTPLVEKRGGAGMIIITDPPEGLIRQSTAKIYPVPLEPPYDVHTSSIPGVVVSMEGGDALLKLLSLGKVKVALEHRGDYSTKKAYNVIGEVQGKEGNEKVVLPAHYDTQYDCKGAWDNGTGVATMLELAKVMSKLHPRRTIVFMGTSCEEFGLWGSSHFVDSNLKDVKKNYRAVITLDAVSSSLCGSNSAYVTPSIEDFTLKATKEMTWQVDAVMDLTPQSWVDAKPFIDAGVPAMWIWENPPIHPYYHSEKDLLRYIDPSKLARTASVNGYIMFKLAYLEELDIPEEG